jgi:4-hydroxy-tetrahydrodipicolinate reductase
MRIALHGYGKMGKTIERIATERGHEIVATIGGSGARDLPPGTEAVVDFSTPAAVERAVELACAAKVGLVIGTTGWAERLEDFRSRIDAAGIGAIYASNFSPGATVMFAVARYAASLIEKFPQYAAGMEERHHAQKKDAPSGTALRIAREVDEGSGGRLQPSIAASRVGSEFGLHTLFFDSPDDVIELSHRARSRDGFARGAVIAAERLSTVKGLVEFGTIMTAGKA